jgi:hypothetical protein
LTPGSFFIRIDAIAELISMQFLSLLPDGLAGKQPLATFDKCRETEQ